MSGKKTGITLTLFAALFFFACGGRNHDNIRLNMGASSPGYARFMAGSVTAAFDDSVSWSRQEGDFSSPDVSESVNLTHVERRLIKSAFIRIRVENLDIAAAFVSDLMSKYSAYAASTTIQENSRHYSLRVPSHHYDAFLAEMNGMGRLIHRSENTEDVTLRYFDLEGRLESKRELLRTFQSYLGRANNIEEILSVEARIADLQREIEFVGTQLRNLANRIDYSTIDLNLLGPVGAPLNRRETFGERSRQLLGNFGGFLSTVAIVLLGIVIYGIPILVVLSLLFWVLFGRIGLLKKLWHVVMNK